MCEQLALLADLKRRNITIVEDALKFNKQMCDFKVFNFIITFVIYHLNYCNGFIVLIF